MGLKTFREQLEQDRLYDQEMSHFAFLTNKTHELIVLGEVDNRKTYLFKSKNPNGVLVTAGWQGDEPAGIEACKILAKDVSDCSFIPVACPSCFVSRQHRNDYGKNADRGWPNPTAGEGKILEASIGSLIELGGECMISLQEDPHRPFSYFYSWNTSNNIKQAVKGIMEDYFPLWEGGIHSPPNDAMFANYFIKSGCKMAVQLETPADGTRTLALRTACQVDCCKAILALI